jgi:hypothetical protein
MGEAARERVREEFLGVRHLLEYARLLDDDALSGGDGRS